MFWLSDCTNQKKDYDLNTNVTWNVSPLYETKNDYDHENPQQSYRYVSTVCFNSSFNGNFSGSL